MTPPPRIAPMSVEEATHLLQRGAFVGRVGFLHDGRVHVIPVNYLAETADSIAFCSMDGTKLSALAGGAAVVFEVDEQRPLYHAGWSVIARGWAEEVVDPAELERLRRGPLRSWAASAGGRWIRIRVDEITGRRIPEH